jgi:hypothetical protein
MYRKINSTFRCFRNWAGKSIQNKSKINVIDYAFMDSPATMDQMKNQLGNKHKLYSQIIEGVCLMLVTIIYFWIFTGGDWRAWPEDQKNYDQLATAFTNGHLFLNVKPDPELLKLPDPYQNSILRKKIAFPWDTSLYKDKIYLYWGPVPALLLALIKPIYNGPVSDSSLTFFFSCGQLISSFLVIQVVREKIFKTMPIWTVALAIFLVGLVYPIPSMLHGPGAYEAAIMSGQFFLLLGLYWVYKAIVIDSISKWKLTIAGLLWALAVGCRATLVVPIAFLVCLTILEIIQRHKMKTDVSRIWLTIFAFGLPLALGTILYGWYNYSRFGSPLETGLRYQLTVENLHEYYNLVFSMSYIHSNLHNYLLNPFKVIPAFPFISMQQGKDLLAGGAPHELYLYRIREITGLLYSFPYILFAAIPIIATTIIEFKKISHQPIDHNESSALIFLVKSLAGVFMLAFLVLQPFFSTAMRYLDDSVPSLVLLSILGFWMAYRYFANNRIAQTLLSIVSVSSAMLSIYIGLALQSR